MDQHRVAGLKCRQNFQAVDRGKEGRAEAGPQLRAEALRQGHAQLGAANHMAGQAAHRQGRQHPLPHQRWIHPLTHSRDPAHTLTAEGHLGRLIQAQLAAVVAQQAEGVEHVAEVEARGLHRHLQLAGGRGFRAEGFGPQALEQAKGARAKPEPSRQQRLHAAPQQLNTVEGQHRLALGLLGDGAPGNGHALNASIRRQLQGEPTGGGLLQSRRAHETRQCRLKLPLSLQHQPHGLGVLLGDGQQLRQRGIHRLIRLGPHQLHIDRWMVRGINRA